MKKSAALFLSILLFNPYSVTAQIPAPPVNSPQAQIGIVAAVGGVVNVQSPQQVGRVVESGESIYLGDEVSTDAKGQLQILLMDETVFTIGPNSRIVIDEFVFDPATHDGKIDARVVEGAFRLVTGKIGRKKPSNVGIKLPAGEVGIRGTILYGVVNGAKSDLLLLGPGEKNNTSHRNGKILVTNDVNGSPVTEEVKKSGFGSTIPGENQSPTPAFELSEDQLNEMTSALNPSDDDEGDDSDSNADGGGNQGSKGSVKKAGAKGAQKAAAGGDDSGDDSDGDSSGGDDGGGDFGGGDVGDMSGQDGADGLDFADDADSLGDFFEGADSETSDAVQDSLDDLDAFIPFGITELDDLQDIEYGERGNVHFHSFSNPIYHNDTADGGTFEFEIDVDYASRSIGGGNSKVVIDAISSLFNTGAPTTFNVPSVDFEDGLDDLSIFFIEDLTASCMGSDCTADVTIALFNDDTDPAQSMLVGVEAVDPNNSNYTIDAAAFDDDGEQSGFAP